ncbi:MAG: hypothetical protein JNM93_13190 [Bacteriovoracaceae bacterium]|nr:hypothetical protein [Bacteriovoracaceae bacterium]
MKNQRNYPLFLILSLGIHLLLMSTSGLEHFLGYTPPTEEQKVQKARQIVHVKLLGIDEGSLDNHAYLRYSEVKSDRMANLLSYSKTQYQEDSLYFKKGSTKKGPKTMGETGKLNGEENEDVTTTSNAPGKMKIKRGKESLEAEVGQGSFFSQSQSPIFSNTNMNVKVKIPRGINMDRLNQLDLIYTSFIARLSQNFQASFHRNLNSFIFSNPHFPSHIPNYKQELTGLLTYDREGNLMRIQTLRLSDEQMLTDYFMQVLNDVHTIQNLPEPLINDDDNFEVTVNLTLN